jgi:hypothetical protein
MPKQEAAGLPWPAQAARRQTTRQSDPAIRDSSAYRQKPTDDTERTTSVTAQSELDAAKTKLATLQKALQHVTAIEIGEAQLGTSARDYISHALEVSRIFSELEHRRVPVNGSYNGQPFQVLPSSSLELIERDLGRASFGPYGPAGLTRVGPQPKEELTLDDYVADATAQATADYNTKKKQADEQAKVATELQTAQELLERKGYGVTAPEAGKTKTA